MCNFCTINETCCGTTCVDLQNDPAHCGDCSTKCDVQKDACIAGHCVTPGCSGIACTPSQLCCGTSCCDQNQICCEGLGPVTQLYCFTPTSTQTTCPAQ